MKINVALTEAQLKALLSEEVSIEACANRILANKAERIIDRIIESHGDQLTGVTAEERAAIAEATKGRVITDPSRLPRHVREIVVKRATIKSMTQKAEESLLRAPVNKSN